MQTEKRVWTLEKGWQVLSQSNLKHKAQLVVASGSQDGKDQKEILNEIKEFYPNARVIFSTPFVFIPQKSQRNKVNITAFEFESGHFNYSRLYL